MGRSPKVGLDYFRLDVQLDTKFELIEAEFGLTGFAVVVRLYQRIYGGAGYYCEWDDEVALVFASRNHVGASAVSEIVKAAIKRKLFDQGMFEKYHILTSHGIQEWYFEAVSRREQVEVIREYLLINADTLPKNVNINRISADRNPISDDRNPHSIAEDSIGKDSIAEDSIDDEEERAREAADPLWDRFVKEYEQNIGLMPHTAYELEELTGDYGILGPEVMSEAIRATALAHADNPHTYFRRVCQKWIEVGIRTADQAKAAMLDFQRRKAEKSRGGGTQSGQQDRVNAFAALARKYEEEGV